MHAILRRPLMCNESFYIQSLVSQNFQKKLFELLPCLFGGIALLDFFLMVIVKLTLQLFDLTTKNIALCFVVFH